MLDQVAVAVDLADQVGLVAPGVEIAVADLAVVVRPDRIVALADMHHHVHVLGQALDGHVDDVDRRADLARRWQAVK